MKYETYNFGSTINIDELKKILLSILDEVDDFCRRNNIRYFLLGGTLLGAIRHNGYIPWDDDIDICLLRKDYEKLISEFQSSSGHVKIITHKNKANYNYVYAKAIDTKTILIETDISHAIGVYIDIFPLDDMPDDMDECRKIVRKIALPRNIMTLKHLKVSKERSGFKNAVVKIGNIIFKIVPDQFFLNRLDSLYRDKRKGSTGIRVANLGGAWGEKEIFFKEDFSAAIEHPFEGRKYLIPKGYDRILKSLYGDYMKLPPEEKRITHHGFSAYWLD